MLENLPRVLMGSSPKQMPEPVDQFDSITFKHFMSLVYFDSPSVLPASEQCASFVIILVFRFLPFTFTFHKEIPLKIHQAAELEPVEYTLLDCSTLTRALYLISKSFRVRINDVGCTEVPRKDPQFPSVHPTNSPYLVQKNKYRMGQF
jgi:hypothetical protein